jgi:hypothetical protein
MDIGRVTWRKASYSSSNGGNCVEVGTWRKASYSGSNGGECVEVGTGRPAVVAVRDSKDPQGPALAFAPDQWLTFTAQLKSDTLDLT